MHKENQIILTTLTYKYIYYFFSYTEFGLYNFFLMMVNATEQF
jgi:hypothetical protein